MTRFLLLLCACASLATGCGGSKGASEPTPPAPATDCTPATAHVAQVMIEEYARLAAANPGVYPVASAELLDSHRQTLAGELDGQCRTGGWTAEATACMTAASADSFEGCYVHLTAPAPEQVGASIKARIEAIVADAKRTSPPT